MAKIRDRRPRDSSGGYERLFGIPELGALISCVQSAVISAGNELERMIFEMVEPTGDLDEFLKDQSFPDGVFIAPKAKIKKCRTLGFSGGEPDFLIFKRREGEQHCHVVELKDGHVFDTKKARIERINMQSFIKRNRRKLNCTMICCHFVAFNQNSRESIVDGFKREITLEEAMTGREFCDLLELDYDEINDARKGDEPDNVEYFLNELVKIAPVREMLRNILKQSND